MSLVGAISIIGGLILLIYSEKSKDKVNIYIRIHSFKVLNHKGFFGLQRFVIGLNAMCLIVFGIIVIKYDLRSMYIILYPLIFHLINFIIIPISRFKKYIK